MELCLIHALFCLLNFSSDSIPFHENHGLVICSPRYVDFVVSVVASAAIPPFAPPTAYSLMISVMSYCVDALHLCHEHHVIYSTAISFVLQRV